MDSWQLAGVSPLHPRLPDWNGAFPLFHFQEGVSEFISRHLGVPFSSYARTGPVSHCSTVAMEKDSDVTV